MSRNMKIVLGVVGVVLLLGCVAVMAGGFLLANFTGRAMDPAQARTVAASIADYDLPDGYRELMGVDMMGMKMAMIGPDGVSGADVGDRGLVIMMMQAPAGQDADQLRDQMMQSFGAQTGMGGARLEPVGTETATIRGSEVELQVLEGESANGQRIRALSGVFEGKSGPALLMVMGPADDWDETQVNAFLASLR
jgi:hypothetical protein